MKGTRALGLIAASATAALPLLAAAPLGATAASAPPASTSTTLGVLGTAPQSPSAAPLRHRLIGAIKPRGSRLLLASGKLANARKAPDVTAKWLPKGCKLIEIGPANAGYTAAQMCPLPKGFHLRRGYMLVRGSVKPAVHTSSGASG